MFINAEASNLVFSAYTQTRKFPAFERVPDTFPVASFMVRPAGISTMYHLVGLPTYVGDISNRVFLFTVKVCSGFILNKISLLTTNSKIFSVLEP